MLVVKIFLFSVIIQKYFFEIEFEKINFFINFNFNILFRNSFVGFLLFYIQKSYEITKKSTHVGQNFLYSYIDFLRHVYEKTIQSGFFPLFGSSSFFILLKNKTPIYAIFHVLDSQNILPLSLFCAK